MKENIKELKKSLSDRFFKSERQLLKFTNRKLVEDMEKYITNKDLSSAEECINEWLLEENGFTLDDEDVQNDVWLVAVSERTLEEMKRETKTIYGDDL